MELTDQQMHAQSTQLGRTILKTDTHLRSTLDTCSTYVYKLIATSLVLWQGGDAIGPFASPDCVQTRNGPYSNRRHSKNRYERVKHTYNHPDTPGVEILVEGRTLTIPLVKVLGTALTSEPALCAAA